MIFVKINATTDLVVYVPVDTITCLARYTHKTTVYYTENGTLGQVDTETLPEELKTVELFTQHDGVLTEVHDDEASENTVEWRCEHCNEPMDNLSGVYVMASFDGSRTKRVCIQCIKDLERMGWSVVAQAK